MTDITENRPLLDRVVKHFGPQWFGSTMGLGALGLSLTAVASQFALPAVEGLGVTVLLVTAVLTVSFTVPWLLRFVLYPRAVERDLRHPIRSQFFPTMPITLIILGLGVERTMGSVLSASLVHGIGLVLFGLGTIGIAAFGFLLVGLMFTNEAVENKHGVFAWYIPPVSHLVIPILGLTLVESAYGGTMLGQALFLVSMAALGVGTFMFIFIGAIVLYRYMYETLPETKLAPTFVIGLAPTSILVVDIAHVLGALEAGVGLGIPASAVAPGVTLVALLLWGFSAWWFLLTGGIVAYYIWSEDEHPFFFTWWAYTFPVGAFALSVNALHQLVGLQLLQYVFAGVTTLLVTIVFVTVVFTSRMVARGNAFVPE